MYIFLRCKFCCTIAFIRETVVGFALIEWAFNVMIRVDLQQAILSPVRLPCNQPYNGVSTEALICLDLMMTDLRIAVTATDEREAFRVV